MARPFAGHKHMPLSGFPKNLARFLGSSRSVGLEGPTKGTCLCPAKGLVWHLGSIFKGSFYLTFYIESSIIYTK